MKIFLSFLLMLGLASCGGGGGGGGNTTPAPVVNVSLNQSKTTIGLPVTLIWSSTNATSCNGSDSMSSGSQPTSGSKVITPNAGGQFTYTISCAGAGGTNQQSVKLIVPIPVQRTSYLNFKYLNIPTQKMPVGLGFRSNEEITAGHSYGDFFQDGTIAMVAFSNVFAGANGYGSLVPGRVYFFHTDGNGGWVDQTQKLIFDRTGCISPRKVIVADFNGDEKPDIFVACHGIDGEIPAGSQQGEHPRYLLSNLDGTYKNVELPLVCYCHGAAAVDFDGTGFADIVVASPPVLNRMAYLKNKRDGTFLDSPILIPQSTNNKSIWSLDFVDINNDGAYDLAVYGSENNNGWNADPKLIGLTTPGTAPFDWQPTIFLNDGSNQFSDKNKLVKLPFTANGDVLDIIVKDSKIAVLRAANNINNKLIIQLYAYPSITLLSTTLVPNMDTVWFRLYNYTIINEFSSNPYSIPF